MEKLLSNDTHKECPFVDCASSDAFSLLEYDKGKTHHVGYFDNLEEAKYSRDIKAKQLHGEFFNDKHRTPSLSL